MALYDNIDNSIKQRKQKLNNSHIRNLKIMNILNALVMALLIVIDVFLLIKGIFTGMPQSTTVLLIIFVVLQVGSLLVFSIKKFARASMITKVGIMIICFLPIIPYIIYLSIGNNVYIACLIARIIGLIALAMLLFNTKVTNDKKTFGVKGVPLAIASVFALLVVAYILVSTTNRKVIYAYDNLYSGYVVKDVLAGQGKVEISEETVGISDGALKNVSGNLVIPKNVKVISKDAFKDSKITSLTVYSGDIQMAEAINNSEIETITLESENAKLDVEGINKDINIEADRTVIDAYREQYRKYDYLFVPEVDEGEFYVCFNGTNLPVYIFNSPRTIEEPMKSALPSSIDGRSILYDGYYVNNSQLIFPFTAEENTKIACKYSFVYNVSYDYSDCEDTYHLPTTYYSKLGDITLPSLEKEGYAFDGWYDIDQYGNYTKEYTKLDSSLDKDINLKAKFLKEFKVTYNKVLEAATLDGDEEIIYTEEDTIELQNATLDGFTFDGWYLDSSYQVPATTYLNSDTTLYAKWSINEPTITLSDNIDKVFDNTESTISVSAVSNTNNVSISYKWYNSANELIIEDNEFNVINAADSNEYYALITLNYKDLIITDIKTDIVDVNIKKATYDTSNLVINPTTYVYDGYAHTPSLSGTLPIGIDNIQITYSFVGGITNVGSADIVCEFNTISENYEIPEPMSAPVTITQREVSIIWGNTLTFEYDGELKIPSYTLNNVLTADKDSIKCNVTGAANAVGTHTAKATSLAANGSSNVYKNYILTTDESNLQIEFEIVSKVNEITGISVENVSAEYDGQIHLPKVTIEPSGVEAIYSLQPINVGTYNVTVTFQYTNNENEKIGNTYNATVIITQREIELSWSFKEVLFNSDVQVPTYKITNIIGDDNISLDYSYVNSVNAGTYTIEYLSILGDDKDNYKLPSENYEYTINPVVVTIDLDSLGYTDKSYTYNGKNQYPTIDESKLPEHVVVTYSGYGKNAGTYNVLATFSINSTNRIVDSATSSIEIEVTINKLAVEITWGQTSFIYDGYPHVPTATVVNLQSGDTCNVTVTVQGVDEAIDAGETYTAKVAGVDNNNYKLPAEDITTTFTIEQQDYDFSFTFDNVSYVYDGQYHMPQVDFGSEQQPEWLTVEYDTTLGIRNVGSLVVTATFTSSNPSYKVPSPVTAVVSITAKEAEIVFTLVDNTYNGSAIYPTATVANLISGDTATVKLDSGENNINVGTNYIVYANEILDNANYKISTPVAYTYEIKKATYSDISSIIFDNQTYVYDGYAHRPSITIDNESGEIKGADNVIVTVKYSEGLTNVGSKLVTATFTVSANYNDIPSLTATVTITQKEVVLTWSGSSFVYTGEVIKPECILSGLVLNDECDFTINAQGVNVGTYQASVSNLTNANYKLPSNSTFEYTITKATLSLGDLTFAPSTKVYDSTYLYPEISGTIPDGVEISYEGLSADAGTHTITIVFDVSDNYNDIASKEVDVEITKRPVSVTWTDLEAVYTGTISYPSYEISNIIANDECTLTISGGGIDVGEYTISVIGVSNDNYSIADLDTVTYSIIAADYDMSGVSFNNVELEYNGSAQSPTISGTLPSGLSVSYSTGATNVSDGTVTVTATFTSADTNYNTPKPMKATVKIIAKELTVVWSNTTFTYDGSKHSPTATLSGLIGSDSCSATLSGYGIIAGEHTCSIVSLSNTNYQANSEVTFTINKADYDMSAISVSDQTYTYDGTSHSAALSGSLSSVIGLDGISPEISEYIGSVTNVSEGEVLCGISFTTASTNYNVPETIYCYISVTPITLSVTVSLDTNSSTTARVNNNNLYIEFTYDGEIHTLDVAINDTSAIVSGDAVEFSVDGEFKNHSTSTYTSTIICSNTNYAAEYTTIYVYVNYLNTGYNWDWTGDFITWWNTTEDYHEKYAGEIIMYYEDTTLGTLFEEEVTAYGNYYIYYASVSNNIVIENPIKSPNTYDISLTTTSLMALINYYDSDSDGIILDYDIISVIEDLYNELGVVDTSIEKIINDSLAALAEKATIINFTAKNTCDSSLCTVTGNINNNLDTTRSYFGHTFEKALKMESSTNIALDLSDSTFTTMILVTDGDTSKRIRINGTEHYLNSDGILKITNPDEQITITKYSSINLWGIILI